jgi:hypothetical protein
MEDLAVPVKHRSKYYVELYMPPDAPNNYYYLTLGGFWPMSLDGLRSNSQPGNASSTRRWFTYSATGYFN